MGRDLRSAMIDSTKKTLEEKMSKVHVNGDPLFIREDREKILKRAKSLLAKSKCSKNCVLYGNIMCHSAKAGDECKDVIFTKVYKVGDDFEWSDVKKS